MGCPFHSRSLAVGCFLQILTFENPAAEESRLQPTVPEACLAEGQDLVFGRSRLTGLGSIRSAFSKVGGYTVLSFPCYILAIMPCAQSDPLATRLGVAPATVSAAACCSAPFIARRGLCASVLTSFHTDVGCVPNGRADRGPKEIAAEIEPSKEARDSTQGAPRLDMAQWVLAHEGLVKQMAEDKKQVCALSDHECKEFGQVHAWAPPLLASLFGQEFKAEADHARASRSEGDSWAGHCMLHPWCRGNSGRYISTP